MKQVVRARRGSGRIIALIINLALIGVAAGAYFNREFILDSLALLNYTPPTEVTALAKDDTMTALAQRYLYASHPTVDDRTTFNTNCKNNDEQTIVLGCYSNRQLHIFDVSDQRLHGVKQVTLAHETLHAAYQRLSPSERARVNIMIERQVQITGPQNEHIQGLINVYNRTEPGELDNEMHSILGTEVRDLNPELEVYYKQYFDNRGQIAGYADQYQAIFTSLRTQQTGLVGDLNALAATVNSRSAALNAALSQLNDDVSAFNRRASSNQFASQAEFDAARAQLIVQQQQLSDERSAIQSLIAEYNDKRQQLQSLNLEAQSLNTSIDSLLAPVPTVQ